MGTRADFYIGHKDGEMKWMGSIAWDGYPSGVDDAILEATDAEEYAAAVDAFFESREDTTRPEQGWPWPWDNSGTTDYAYIFDFDAERVLIACFGSGWAYNEDEVPKDEDGYSDWSKVGKVNFPDMSDQKNVAMDNRSGLIIL